MRLAVAVAVAVAVGLGGVASADEGMFEGAGQAPISGGDQVRARERALDDAMVRAVEQSVAASFGVSLTPERTARLRASVYPRARQFVETYRILEEGGDGSTFRVRISARVASAQIAAIVDAQPPRKPLPATRQRALVCSPDKTVEQRLLAALAARNVEGVANPAACADGADLLGALRAAAAQGALLGTAAAQPAGFIRGTLLHVTHAQVALRLVDDGGREAMLASVERDGWAAEPERAVTAALSSALDGALVQLAPALGARWPAGAASLPGGTLLVRVDGVERYPELLEVQRAIASSPGVTAVLPRRFSATGIELEVRTATPTTAAVLAPAVLRNAGALRLTLEPTTERELRIHIDPNTPSPVEPRE